MGIRIIKPSGELIDVQAFTKAQLKLRTVQLRCNLKLHEHNLIFGKALSVNRIKNSSDEFIIEFSLITFNELAKLGTKEIILFAKKLKTTRSLAFSPINLPLVAEMHQCIYRITRYEGDDRTKKLFLYAQVMNLLLLQQQSYIRTNTPQLFYVKNEYDKERIVFARDYLLTHMDAPPSLIQLAAIAGINEFKLKRGFKELFNQSVFAYLATIRLEMARRALQQKQKTVTQIAFELGYASLQHFSAAFKKKYGVSPGKFN